MFSMCSELTPRARIPDTRIPQLMRPCSTVSFLSMHICSILYFNFFDAVVSFQKQIVSVRHGYSHNYHISCVNWRLVCSGNELKENAIKSLLEDGPQRWRAIIAITNKLLVGGQTAWSSFSGKVQPTHPELRPRGVSIEYFDQVRKHAF